MSTAAGVIASGLIYDMLTLPVNFKLAHEPHEALTHLLPAAPASACQRLSLLSERIGVALSGLLLSNIQYVPDMTPPLPKHLLLSCAAVLISHVARSSRSPVE